jgi:type II secretory pathway component PulF
LLFYIIFKLPFWLTLGRLRFFGLAKLVYQLQFKLPLISSWLIRRQVNEFFRSLGIMLTAGMPILDALPKALNTIANPIVKSQFKSVVEATRQGSQLTDALADVPEIDEQAIQMILAGEKSGKLAEAILHHTKIETEKIELQEDLLAEWIPRLFYLLVVFWVASSII